MSLRPRAAATTTLVAAIVVSVGSHVTAGASAPSVLPLNVLLTVSSALAPLSRQTLISEAERIWRHERVHIEWTQPGDAIERPNALRVLVITRPQTARGPRKWAVAELFPEAEPRAFAIASISDAARVVDEATQSAQLDAHALPEYRLGLVLGRAVAHEIGHFLLATGTHANSGLMRASIDAREFAALGGHSFRLDRDASEWIRRQFATHSAAVDRLRALGFSYSR